MNEKYEKLLNSILLFFVIQLVIIFASYKFFTEFLPFMLLVMLIFDSILILALSYYDYRQQKSRLLSIQQILGKEAKDALIFGDIGLVTFDENYEITWMSELFDSTAQRFIGEKISSWIPETSDLVRGNKDEIIVNYRNYIYKISRFKQGNTLFIKDVTRQEKAVKDYQDNRVVLGLVHLDNYEDETQFDDEQKATTIDVQIRQPLINWAKQHGMFIRRVRPDRFMLVLNEKIFNQLVSENFDILSETRKASLKNDLSITLSIAFSKGTHDFSTLENMTNAALELTQGRGGDQVAVKTHNEEIQYFGGSSQAQEKLSKVRVRVLAHTIVDMVLNSENVIIGGHNNMDFDCFGAALGISKIIQSYNKPVSILCQSGGLEEKLDKVISQGFSELNENHHLIDENEALDLIKPSTLLILVDHHSLAQSNAQQVIGKVGKIAIIDHHRRTSDFKFNPALAYIETTFSSTSEMVAEFFLYQRKAIELTELEATIMYTGIVIDTNHFRVRSGVRTFEAVAQLRTMKANPSLSASFLKDTFDEFELKSSILSKAELLDGFVLISYDEKVISRTIMSMIADEVLDVEGIEASFVIAKLEDNKVGVSARSKGNVNVQILMEKLGGGGHFTAAASQRENTTVAAMTQEVKNVIHGEKEEENESHTLS